MAEKVFVLRYRLKTFSAVAVVVIGGDLVFGLWVFGRMVLDGVNDWRVLLLFGFCAAILIAFFYFVPLNMRLNTNDLTVRYLIGRTARYDLQHLSHWQWRTNTSGDSGLYLTFKTGRGLTIPPMLMDARLPAVLNSFLSNQEVERPAHTCQPR
jgi:hypothetical protein